jgi:hypothetical protein
LKPAQYSTQLAYAKEAINTKSGAPYRASFFENFDSSNMKSTNRATPGAACKERSTGRGIRNNGSADEDDSAFGSFSKIKVGKNRSSVQYIDDITTANWNQSALSALAKHGRQKRYPYR